MKKAVTFLMGMALFIAVSAQNSEKTEGTTSSPGKFFFGVNYSYHNVNLKLLSMTNHSVWDDQDFGTVNVDQDQIDTLNSFVDCKDRLNAYNLTAGMVILNKPGKHWYIDGQLFIGLTKRKYSIVNTTSNTTDLTINSENFSPCFGIGLDFKYLFDERWGVNINPSTLYSFGTTNEIDDKLYPITEFMIESRDNKYNLSYSQINLLASYAIKRFTIEAGPGFYFSYNIHKYDIVRTNPEDGKIYEDLIETKLKTDNFINGTLHLEWRFSDHFRLNAGAGISKDISVTAGLVYFL